MASIAYLIGSADDRRWVGVNAPGAPMIAHDAVTHRQFPDAPYFFPPSDGDGEAGRQVRHLVVDWYRDDAGRDRYAKEGVSFAQVISGSAWIAIASYVREWQALAALLGRYSRVGVSRRESERFTAVARSFGDRVLWYDPGTGAALVATCNDRVLARQGYPLHNQLRARLARLASRPARLLSRSRRDTLYINDWTLRRHVENDPTSRTLFGRRVMADTYPVLNEARIARAGALFDSQPLVNVRAADLAASLARIGAAWPVPLLELVASELQERARALRGYLVDCHALFEDLLDTYRPARIVLSGETLEPHTLLMQLARSRSIRVYHLLDGYLPTLSVSHPPAYRTSGGDDWLITDVLASGRASAEHFEAMGFPKQRITVVPASFIKTEQPSDAVRWDASIATWVCNHLDPQGREEWTCVMVCEVAELLASMGMQRIAVKVKARHEVEIYRELQRRGLLIGTADVVWEPFQQHLSKTRLVVGGLSTGVLEAFHAGVPYYVYEPFENGYSNACLESRMLDSANVARTIAELGANIAARVSAVVRSRQDLFDGAAAMPWISDSAATPADRSAGNAVASDRSPPVDDAWANRAAALIARAIEQRIATTGSCSLMLTGGRAAERIYRCWSATGAMHSSFARLHILFGDERCVPPHHDDSNYALAMRAWLKGADNRSQVARIKAEGPDRDAAALSYEAELPEAVDVLILSVGEDGHIASLFPGSAALHELKRKVVAVDGPKPLAARLTVTPRVISSARSIFLLATGEAKGAVLKRALAAGAIDELPVRLVLPRATLIADASAEQAMAS